MKKRLISLFTAFAMVLMLGAVLPAGGLKAIAADAMTVSVFFDSEKAELTVTWTESAGAANYQVYIKNKNLSGSFQYMKGADPRVINAGQERKTVYEITLFQKYAYGTSDYIVTVMAFGADGWKTETADSKVITTDYEILDAPSNVKLSQYGIASWDKVDKATSYSVILVNADTGKNVTSVSTKALSEDLSEKLTAGGRYYITVESQPMLEATPIYRYSDKVMSRTVTYATKSDITGIGWAHYKLYWDSYEGASKYKLVLCKHHYTYGDNVYGVFGTYESDTTSYDFTDIFKDKGYGTYKVSITAQNDDDQPISNPTESKTVDKFKNVKTVNVKITPPVGGAKPDYNISTDDADISLSDRKDYLTSKCLWKYAGTPDSMPADEVFESGEKYTAYFYIYHYNTAGKEPLCINEDTEVIVNGDIKAEYAQYNYNSAMFKVTFTAARKPGDISGDGVIDIKDVTLLKQHLAKWKVKLNLANADVNDDKSVDIKDLTILKQYIAKWKVELK